MTKNTPEEVIKSDKKNPRDSEKFLKKTDLKQIGPPPKKHGDEPICYNVSGREDLNLRPHGNTLIS